MSGYLNLFIRRGETMSLKSNILGIDTATAETVIGLNEEVVSWVSDRRSAQSSRPRGNQSKELLPKIDTLIRGQKLTPQKLRGVAVNVGPGSFTGLRVGLTVANGFGFALKIPLMGISEFDITRLFFPKADLIVLDAKRNELFVQIKKQMPKLIPTAKLGGLIKRGMSVYVEPNLALALHSQLEKAGTIYLGEIPRVERMTAVLATTKLPKKFTPVLPLYLRGANITKVIGNK